MTLRTPLRAAAPSPLPFGSEAPLAPGALPLKLTVVVRYGLAGAEEGKRR